MDLFPRFWFAVRVPGFFPAPRAGQPFPVWRMMRRWCLRPAGSSFPRGSGLSPLAAFSSWRAGRMEERARRFAPADDSGVFQKVFQEVSG